MSTLSTHVLDTTRGRPAAGIDVALHVCAGAAWTRLTSGTTDEDGRISDLLTPISLEPGHYRLTFNTGAYYQQHGQAGFYPTVEIQFTIGEATEHYHVPLLLSPFGYSTYRGS